MEVAAMDGTVDLTVAAVVKRTADEATSGREEGGAAEAACNVPTEIPKMSINDATSTLITVQPGG